MASIPTTRTGRIGPAWAGPFAELIAWRTYSNAIYLLIALPLGIAYFVALIVGFAVGLALAITLIGVPILLGTVALVSGFAGIERSQARTLVGLEMPASVREGLVLDGSRTQEPVWAWARSYVTRAVFWKSLTYLFLKLPWGIVSFTITVTLVALGVAFLAAPFYVLDLPITVGIALPYAPSLPQALALSVIGLGVCMIAARTINLMALGSARIARFMLSDDQQEAETQRLRVEALTLASSAASLVSSLGDRDSLTRTLEHLMASVGQASSANACALVVVSGATRRVAAAHGFAASRLEAALNEIPALEPPTNPGETRVLRPRALNGLTLAVIPLEAGGRGFGQLIAAYPNGSNPNRSELEFLRAIADQSSLGLENARLISAARDGAALEERHRLARELHDSVSQALYGIALGARTAKTQLVRDPAKVAEPLEYVLQLAEAGLTEMRALIFELRPEALETEGLAVALRKQADAVRVRYKLQVETALGEELDVSLEVKQALLRIAQEALHNTVKHARASHARIGLETSPSGIRLEIADDGAGFDPNARFDGHLGQRSMRERAEAIGAHYALETAPGAGTRIRVQLPLEPKPT